MRNFLLSGVILVSRIYLGLLASKTWNTFSFLMNSLVAVNFVCNAWLDRRYFDFYEASFIIVVFFIIFLWFVNRMRYKLCFAWWLVQRIYSHFLRFFPINHCLWSLSPDILTLRVSNDWYEKFKRRAGLCPFVPQRPFHHVTKSFSNLKLRSDYCANLMLAKELLYTCVILFA